MSGVDRILADSRAGVRRYTPHETEAARRRGALVVDTRTETQRAEVGELPGALVIDRTVLEWRLDPASETRIPEATGYDIEVIVVCRQGFSSSLAAESLRRVGLRRATDLAGGVEAWLAAGAAVVTRRGRRAAVNHRTIVRTGIPFQRRSSLRCHHLPTPPRFSRRWHQRVRIRPWGDMVDKRVRRLCAAISAGVLSVGIAVTPAQADVSSLVGTVTDLATGDPIAGACVSALNYETGAEVARACTGADGSYALSVPEEGLHKVRATADTYHELFDYNQVSIEKAAAVYLRLTETRTTSFALFHETATVSGRITDAGGAPVESADVRVVREDSWDTYYSPGGYSDADGNYTVTGIIPGRYRVVFNDNVLGQVFAQHSETRDGATVFTLADGASLTVNDSFLPMATVEVTVVDRATQAPITTACVSAQTGRESVCNAANGVYRVENVRPGYQSLDVGAGTHKSASLTIEPVRGQTLQVRVELVQTEAIVTRVVDRQTGQPIESACVMIASPGDPGLSANQSRSCSGPDGRLVVSLEDSPGTYQLYAYTYNGSYGAQWVGMFGGTGNRELARPVTVGAGANVTIPPIRMDQPGSITGVVRKPDGTPGYACALPYAPHAGGLWRETPSCTDAQGRYTINSLGPYRWPVLFMGDTWLWSGNMPNRYAATKVQVVAGQAATRDATVPVGTVVTGVVRNAAGAQASANVEVYNAFTGDFAGPTTGSGTSTPYRLKALAPQQQVHIKYLVWSTNNLTCYYNGTTDRARATALTVQPNTPTVSLDLTGCG